MTTPIRPLVAVTDVGDDVRRPNYRPDEHGIGIVHLGFGAFHRAHQAVATDDALAARGGDWRIAGASLRSSELAHIINAQNGLYTVIEKGADGSDARLIGSVARVIAAREDPAGLMGAMTDGDVRIVSLTVTEKAYGIDRAAGGVDVDHPAVVADLDNPRHPGGALGLLVEALRQRREAGTAPFTVLCCDNLPDNGALLRAGVVDFARRVDGGLGDWIAAEVAFPSTMVDRITPAMNDDMLAEAQVLIGCRDQAAIITEPFSQWVIEDNFPQGRPHWEAGGAIFVDDVAPFERMKLRMLNGSHSMLAYAGFLSGCTYVRDVMSNADLAQLVARHLRAASATLPPPDGFDLARYGDDLAARFRNPEVAHETYQIAMDGTEKLPQRILLPALDALAEEQDVAPFAFAAAAWMRYCLGRKDDGTAYSLRDPREERIAALLGEAGDDAASIVRQLSSLDDVFPSELVGNAIWTDAVTAKLASMLGHGVSEAVRREALG